MNKRPEPEKLKAYIKKRHLEILNPLNLTVITLSSSILNMEFVYHVYSVFPIGR